MAALSLKDRLLNLKTAAVACLVVFMLYRLSTTTADPDLWGYLAFGRLFWGSAGFPYQDVFAYVPTLNPWVYHEWLTGVVFYPLYRAFGAPGLQIFKLVMGLATLGVVYLTARGRKASSFAAALTLAFIVAAIGFGYSPVRAQVFTYFFFALSLYLLEGARRSGRPGRLWLLVPIQIVWCNLHGGFLAGLGLILLYGLGEALSRRPFRAYIQWFVLAGLATLINPYGLKYWSYLFQAVTMPRPEITEWVSLWKGYRLGFMGREGFYYFVALIVVTVLAAIWARWREITPILILLFTLALTVQHLRHLVFFALAVGAYIPLLLTAYFQKLSAQPGCAALTARLGRKLPALGLILLMGWFAYKLVSRDPLSLKFPTQPDASTEGGMYYPLGAIAYIEKHHLAGKLLVDFDWGEYCLWRLSPQCWVALDGRYETVYPAPLAREYFDFLMGRPDWRNFLNHYPPDFILIKTDSKIYARLRADAGWHQVYADKGCALFLRPKQVPAAGAAQGRL